MALPCAPAVSRCSGPSGVPPAAARAAEAAQAPAARAQIAGRSAVAQGSAAVLRSSPRTSATPSPAKDAIGQKGADAGRCLSSPLQVEVSGTGEKGASGNSYATVCGARQQPACLGGDPDASGGGDGGLQFQSCLDAASSHSGDRADNLRLLHSSATPAGAALPSAQCEVVKTGTLRSARGQHEHRRERGSLVSRAETAYAAHAAVGSRTAGNVNSRTEEISFSTEAVGAGAPDEACLQTEGVNLGSATTPLQDLVTPAADHTDAPSETLVKTAGAVAGEGKPGAYATEDTISSATLMSSGSGSTSPRTPSTAPSAEPSPSLCLSQPSLAMLIRSGQAALPPPVTDDSFKEEASSNSSNIKSDSAGDKHTTNGGEQRLGGGSEKGEEQAIPKCSDDRKRASWQHYEGNAHVEEAEKAPPPKWDVEVSDGGDNGLPFASRSAVAGGSNRSKAQSVGGEVTQNDTAAAPRDGNIARQEWEEQRICNMLPRTSRRKSDTSGRSVTVGPRREAGACGARGAAVKDGVMAGAAEDTSSRMTCKSPRETERTEAESNGTPVSAGGCAAGAQRPVDSRVSSEPLSFAQRAFSSSNGSQGETRPEQQAAQNQARVHPPEGENGERSRFIGAASFLQKLQRQWETDADAAHCHSLLSQLSVPLPAREKLLPNSAPSVRYSSGSEEIDDASSSVAPALGPRSVSLTPLSTSTAGASPGASASRSDSSTMKHAAHERHMAPGQGRDGSGATSQMEQPVPCGRSSSPVRLRSTAAQSGLTWRRGVQQQQQLETLLRGRPDAAAGGSCGALHRVHDVFSCRTMTPATAGGHTREVGLRAGRERGTPAGADTPSGKTSSDFVAAAAAQVLQQQPRQQQQQQQLHQQPETRSQEGYLHERQQHTRVPENWTRYGAAAALEAVLTEINSFAVEGYRAADEESLNIRRWLECFGISGRRAETAVAAVVKRAVDLQRRLATLLTVTLRQQLNQRLLVLALDILLNKQRREPLRCEEMLREQQRLLDVLETQQMQALADLPHLYGDLPEAQQLQQQLQQLQEAEWQLRTGGDRLAVPQSAAAAAAEQRPCQRVMSRADDLGACSSSHAHRLPASSTCMTRPLAAAPAAAEGPAPVFRMNSPSPSTSTVAEGAAARWTVGKQNQAYRSRRPINEDGRPDASLWSATASSPGRSVFVATQLSPSRAKYLEELVCGSAAGAAAMRSGDAEARMDPATAAELRAPYRYGKQTNSNSIWEDTEPLSEVKQASQNEGGARRQTQEPMVVERFITKQIERHHAACMSPPPNAASANSGPRRVASAADTMESASAAATNAKESWRPPSNVGNFDDTEAVAARGRPTRSSTGPAAPGSPARTSICSVSCRPEAVSEQCDPGVSGRTVAASEGGRSNAAAAVLRGPAAAGLDTCSSRPVETAADDTAAQSGKAHLLSTTRSHAMPLQGSPGDSSVAPPSSSSTPTIGSDTAVSGSFTSVYSRGSNARHQNDPYPHNIMIQLIQPLPTGIKLELKSHRPASLGGNHGVSAVGGSSGSVSSASAAGADVPAPREYALRVSLTRHETKYCSFHSLHGILPAYNEAVRLRNKFAGLPFVLPTMTLQELHQRKEQLDAGRPLPGHGPHEAFMTVQERITYYKQTGISSSNFAKVENASLGTSSTSVCYSPRSASPTSSVTPAAGRSSQNASPVAPGAGSAGSNSVNKTRIFRSSSASSPSGVANVATATPEETDGNEGGRPGIRRVSGEEEQQQQDQMKGCVGRGGSGIGLKRGRVQSGLGSGQQEDRCSWLCSQATTVQHQQQDDTRGETTSKSGHMPKPVARGGKALPPVSSRPLEEGPESGMSQDGKMQLRSRTTSSSGSRSEGTTTSTVTETVIKELTGAAEYRNRGEKRRKIGNGSDDTIQRFLERGCFKSSSSDPDEGVCSSFQSNDAGGYPLTGGNASAPQTLMPGASADRRLAGSIAEDSTGDDLTRILARSGGSRRDGRGGRVNARCPWEELLCWESPPYTHQSPGETTAVESQSVADSGLPTIGDVELLTQELKADGTLSSLLGEDVSKPQRAGSKQSPRRSVAAFMSSTRGTVVVEDWLPCLQTGERRPSDREAGRGAGESLGEGRRAQYCGFETLPLGSSSSSACRKVNAGEPSAPLGMAGAQGRRESTSAEYREDTGDIRLPLDRNTTRNSHSAPTQKEGEVNKCPEEIDWAGGNQVRAQGVEEGTRQIEGGAAGADDTVQEERNDAGQEVDVNEEEARHLSELLLGAGMFGDVDSCNNEAERKRVSREQIGHADEGSVEGGNGDSAASSKAQKERQQVQEDRSAHGSSRVSYTSGSEAEAWADASLSRRPSRSD